MINIFIIESSHGTIIVPRMFAELSRSKWNHAELLHSKNVTFEDLYYLEKVDIGGASTK